MRIHDKEAERNSCPTRVTVVIPCHNHADMIGRAVDSVVSQDYRPVTIAIVNDGSEDNSGEAIQKKIESLNTSDIEFIFTENQSAKGPSYARNKAIKESWETTDVFMMLDADDYYLPGKVSRSVKKYEENKQYVGIVYTDATIENLNKKTRIHEFREPFDRRALERECIISNTPLVSKEAFRVCGMYDEDMRTCEDWDLWLRITENFVAIQIPEPLHIYSVTGKNSSDTVDEEVWRSNWKKIKDRLLQRTNANL